MNHLLLLNLCPGSSMFLNKLFSMDHNLTSPSDQQTNSFDQNCCAYRRLMAFIRVRFLFGFITFPRIRNNKFIHWSCENNMYLRPLINSLFVDSVFMFSQRSLSSFLCFVLIILKLHLTTTIIKIKIVYNE